MFCVMNQNQAHLLVILTMEALKGNDQLLVFL